MWRSYDYPHVVMLYFHMYQIAKMYPGDVELPRRRRIPQSRLGDGAGVLHYPYEIYPAVLRDLQMGPVQRARRPRTHRRAASARAFPKQAAWLRGGVGEEDQVLRLRRPYPFRSEYAFDRTAFESTMPSRNTARRTTCSPDENLWFDLKLQEVVLASAREARGLAGVHGSAARVGPRRARLARSGLLHARRDPGVSYMAAMGGWGMLDYALNFAPRPSDWLQLGYASYLSSWCLMNTGRAGDELRLLVSRARRTTARRAGSSCRRRSAARGWDRAIPAASRAARAVALRRRDRPRIRRGSAHGGHHRHPRSGLRMDRVRRRADGEGRTIEVDPRDGLRRRFDVVIPDVSLPFPEDIRRLKLELDRDGFAADGLITMDKTLAGSPSPSRTGRRTRTERLSGYRSPSTRAMSSDGRGS